MTAFTKQAITTALASACRGLHDLGVTCITCRIDGGFSDTCLFVVEVDEYEVTRVVARRYDPVAEQMIDRPDIPATIHYKLPARVRLAIEAALSDAGLLPQERLAFIYAISGERAIIKDDIVWPPSSLQQHVIAQIDALDFLLSELCSRAPAEIRVNVS